MTMKGWAPLPAVRAVISGCRVLIGALERVPAALPVLLLRCGVALVFWRSGLTKLPLGNDMTVFLFEEEYRVPVVPAALAAYLVTVAELVAPWMLIAGLGARVSAAILLAETLVIQIFVYPQQYSHHLLWAGPLLYVLLRGPGRWSADHLIRRHLDRACPNPTLPD
jgi:putative oxidoreductase